VLPKLEIWITSPQPQHYTAADCTHALWSRSRWPHQQGPVTIIISKRSILVKLYVIY